MDKNKKEVTILILIDGFLQLEHQILLRKKKESHNPYFNRWFSAIYSYSHNKELKDQSQSLF